jgi:hypothetical protein
LLFVPEDGGSNALLRNVGELLAEKQEDTNIIFVSFTNTNNMVKKKVKGKAIPVTDRGGP